MNISEEPKNIEQCAVALRDGELVAFPTETVYGLGADAFNAQAVARIFEVKKRPFFDPLIVHVATFEELHSLVDRLPDCIDEIRDNFWPGPLTLVLPKSDRVPEIVTSGLDSVAVRWPAHPMALELISKADTPVAAPSANLFGRVSPTTAEHVREQLGDDIEYILDGGACGVGVESTIVSFMSGSPVILRHGGLPQEELDVVLGPVEVATATKKKPDAPGMLKKHYAPRTPVVFAELCDDIPCRSGLLSYRADCDSSQYAAVEVLSESGDLREAAANLFKALRNLDNAGLDLIVVEHLPNRGLGRAINDRLEKACTTFHSRA